MRARAIVVLCFALSAVAALAERAMGRTWLGSDGRFGLWEGNT